MRELVRIFHRYRWPREGTRALAQGGGAPTEHRRGGQAYFFRARALRHKKYRYPQEPAVIRGLALGLREPSSESGEALRVPWGATLAPAAGGRPTLVLTRVPRCRRERRVLRTASRARAAWTAASALAAGSRDIGGLVQGARWA